MDRSTTPVLLVLTLLWLTVVTHSQCRGSCSACATRYGCMTPAWGRCCTQFFMHNGKKRSDKGIMEGFVEYIKMKSQFVQGNGGKLSDGDRNELPVDGIIPLRSQEGSKMFISPHEDRLHHRQGRPLGDM